MTRLHKKLSIMGRIARGLDQNGISLTIKTLFTTLSILAVISGGGIILIGVAALTITILISAIGKILVDTQVLKTNDKLNKLDQSIEKFKDVKKKYEKLSPDQKEQIKTFLNTNKDDLLSKMLSEDQTKINIKPNNRLATFDKVNNSVRGVLQVVKFVLMLPYILFNSIKLIPTGIRTVMIGQSSVAGVKTINRSQARAEEVKVKEKTKAINQKITDNNIASDNPYKLAKQAARLNVMVEIAVSGENLNIDTINDKLKDKNPIQYKTMSGAKAFFKSLLQNSDQYTKIIKPLEEIKEKICSEVNEEDLEKSSRKGVTKAQKKSGRGSRI